MNLHIEVLDLELILQFLFDGRNLQPIGVCTYQCKDT
jgi:hypothetical protein